jgi:hypothetical protein
MNTLEYAEYTSWDPKDYLTEYYSGVMSDERFCLEFLIESLKHLAPVEVALDFGSGPIISHLLPLVEKAHEIHVAEYLENNRDELQQWLSDRPNAHNWQPFTREVLRLEGRMNLTDADVQLRENALRQQVTQLLPGDVRDAYPLGTSRCGFYPLVTAHYCAEGVSLNRQDWQAYMRNIMSMVKPGGTLITSACGSGNFYRVADLTFPSTKLDPQDVLNCFWENGFVDIDLRVRNLLECEQGFFYVIFARATKSVA